MSKPIIDLSSFVLQLKTICNTIDYDSSIDELASDLMELIQTVDPTYTIPSLSEDTENDDEEDNEPMEINTHQTIKQLDDEIKSFKQSYTNMRRRIHE